MSPGDEHSARHKAGVPALGVTSLLRMTVLLDKGAASILMLLSLTRSFPPLLQRGAVSSGQRHL